MQKTFSSAVASMEADLEQEKLNSIRFIKILNSINDGVAIMDDKGCLRYANPSLWRLYSISPEDIKNYIGESWLKLHSPKGQQQINDIVLPELKKKNVWLGESNVLTKNDSMLRAELYISKNEEGYIGFIRDVTDRYHAEQGRRQLTLQVHQLQKSDAVERVVRAMVHEFNNSLSSIGGFSEMLIEDLVNLPEQQNYAQKIYQAGRQMQSLVEQTRLLIPGNKADGLQAADLLFLLPPLIESLKKKMPHDFQILQDIDIDKASVRCDAPRLNQMLAHIIRNAVESQKDSHENILLHVDAYKHGHYKIAASKSEVFYHIDQFDGRGPRLQYGHYDPDTKYIRLSVCDHGQGIPAEIMDHILDPFFSTKNLEKKTGLGMAIVRSVIRHCEGFLLIESIHGTGTTVTVLLPVADAAPSGSQPTTAAFPRSLQATP